MLKRTLAGVAVVPLLLLAACSDDGGSGDAAADESANPSETTSEAAGSGSDGACTYTDTGMDPAKENSPPPEEPVATGKVKATIETSAGAIPVTLDAKSTPCTVNSFLSLADQDYFDDTTCHRLTTEAIYVLQCGDPTGTGRGGPGYSFDDELSGDETYPAGTLAMANAGPDTNGSQFFMVYDDTQLSPDYTVFGSIDKKGLAVLEKIADQGTAGGAPDGEPKEPVTIEEVDVASTD